MAQKTTVKGVLMSKAQNESEPFATVRIFKAGKSDKPVAMFLTDENGLFSQEVKGKGKYDIVFSSVGKEDLRQDQCSDGSVMGSDGFHEADLLGALHDGSGYQVAYTQSRADQRQEGDEDHEHLCFVQDLSLRVGDLTDS